MSGSGVSSISGISGVGVGVGVVANSIILGGDDLISVFVSNSSWCDAAIPIKKRFSKSLTVTDFKRKLELVTGGSAATMKIEVYDKDDSFVCELSDNEALLGSYPVGDDMRVHVIDKFVMLYEFTNTDNVEKYTMSEEEYNKKPDSVRAFLHRNKMGIYDQDQLTALRDKQRAETEEEKRLASLITVDSRCEVRVPNQPSRRGTVMFNGSLEKVDKPGTWIGVQYDEPLGKNDGSISGIRFFTCPPKYGGFVKPIHVTVGDFPEEMFDLEDEI